MNQEDLIQFYEKNQRIIISVLLFVFLISTGFLVSDYTGFSVIISIILVILAILTLFSLIRFVNFYTGRGRMEHNFNQFHASHFLSSFYKIYFPVIIVALVVGVIFQLALAPVQLGGLGLLDYQSISPSFMIIFTTQSLITGVGIVALVDYEMKKSNLHYSKKVGKTSFLKSFGYIIPLSGIYFGGIFFVRYLITNFFGQGALIPSQNSSFEIDYGVQRAAKFWDLSTDVEKDLILITFFVIYIAMEFLLRGLISRQAEGYKLGAAGIVLVPAVLQATAFTRGVVVFTDPLFYFFELFDALLLGLILGIIIWRTGNFLAVIFTALFVRLLDTRLEFQAVVMKQLPEFFGEYNPYDNAVTLADTIGSYFIYIQIAIVAIAPFVLVVNYEEVGHVLSGIYNGLKDQWFGLLVLGIAFFLIDLVFSFVSSIPFFGVFVGFLVALIIIGFVLRFFFKVLPEPTEAPILHVDVDMFEGELPLNLKEDINYLDSEKPWYSNAKYIGIIGGSAFIYFLFISATYRQFVSLNLYDTLRFIIFLILLPTTIIGFAAYLIARAQTRGFFFSENWRSTLIIFSVIMFIVNILIWTNTSSTVNFSWRLVPFAIFFILLGWNKPIQNPTRDLALGLARDGRYATFRWVNHSPELFEEEFYNLIELPSENIQVGAYILAAQNGLLDGTELITNLREREHLERGNVLGMIMALGIMEFKPAEGVLLDILGEEDLDMKMASYWTLGKIGTQRALSRMAKILEENPKKDLISIAESSILSIDPNYPLAGIRDSIHIS